MKDLETDIMPIEYYKLGAKFCIHQYKNGNIYAPNPQTLIPFSLTISVKRKKHLDICAIKLNLPKIKTVVITIYRSPIGNYNYFLRKFVSLFESIEQKKYHLWGYKY